MTLKVVALMPAYQEEKDIAEALTSLIKQTYPLTIVVLANGCTDRTAQVARLTSVNAFNVFVEDYPKLPHKKAEAMNMGWKEYAQDADLVITVDADTLLSPTAVEEWVEEFQGDPTLAGSCARFTMLGNSLLTRLQRMDFSMGIDISLRRGWTSVLAGAASCFRGDVLRKLSTWPDREGPWTYASAVEDFEVTYRARRMGYGCHVSPTVRAYTDPMATWKALRGQRMKWNTGTIEDLLKFGLNRTTFVMWCQQLLGWASILILALFIGLLSYTIHSGSWHYSKSGLVLSIGVPFLVWMKNIKHSLRIPYRDKVDVLLAASIIVYEVFSWIRMSWFVLSWTEVLWSKLTRKRKDRWALQYSAETN